MAFFQAEDALLSRAVFANNHAGAQGSGFVDFINPSGDFVEWNINSQSAGSRIIDFRYALGTSPRTMALEINGNRVSEINSTSTRDSRTGWSNWTNQSITVNLAAGINTIRLVAIGESGPNIDGINVPTSPTQSTTLQFEDAFLSGAVIANNHAGAQGSGFVDFINPSGDFVEWNINSQSAGDRTIDFRYALGTSPRKMALEINGNRVSDITFTSTGDSRTGWSNWTNQSITVNLAAGDNTVRLVATGDSGPNIDSVTVTGASVGPSNLGTDTPSTSGPLSLDTRINFQLDGAPVPSGYIADTGDAYSAQRGFGWVTQGSVGNATPSPLDVNAAARDRNVAGTAQQLDTFIHMQQAGLDAGWEYDLSNGTYVVSAALGDPRFFDSNHTLRIEGQTFVANYTPSDTSDFLVATGVVTVNDGRLSVDSIGGTNTKLSYIEFEAISPSRPQLGNAFDGSSPLTNGEVDVSVAADFSISLNVQSSSDVVDASTVSSQSIRLVRTADGAAVDGVANTTGGRDALSFSPTANLEANTQYTLVVDGVKTEGGESFVPYTRTFTTGGSSSGGGGTDNIDFSRQKVFSNGPRIASVVVSPDNQKLYASTLNGRILRWDINQSTGALSNEQSFTVEANHAIIGIEFDPNNPNRLWISNNAPLTSNAPNFSSKISYLDIGTDSSFTASVTDYIQGLPRSIRDHLSNSLEFGPDGFLYLSQGSMSAQGAPDSAWGNRPETLLSAALLKIDPNRNAPAGGFNVVTADGGGNYNPFAANAPLTIYATGQRNAYDLVWHSNGNLYMPTNSSGAGGNAPDDPSTAANEAVNNINTQPDYLYKVEEGGYYGHTNPLRGEYILNGGNPTASTDPGEIVASGSRGGYTVGTQPDPNYRGFAYNFGFNRSPNGVIEYQSNAFNGNLTGDLLVAEYSGGDRILSLSLDGSGNVIGSREVESGFRDPLDLIEHQPTGRLYVVDISGITALTPN
ncbi:MAG: carbohydrate-binding protein [Cyanobacteria bacterium P01_F01_bin.3]